MNQANMQALAAHLEPLPHLQSYELPEMPFIDLDNWQSCVVAHAARLALGDPAANIGMDEINNQINPLPLAMQWLGLSFAQVERLSVNYDELGLNDESSGAEVAAVLRKIAAGEIKL